MKLLRARLHRQESLVHLMEDYVDGSPRAFAALHAAVEPRVRARVRAMVGAHGPVEDLVQTTFLLAHRARDRWVAPPQADDRSVIGWFGTIARNATTTELRRRATRPVLATGGADVPGAVDAQPSPVPDPEAALHEQRATDAHREALHGAMERLPPPQRAVMELVLAGKPMAEIANMLGIKPVAARVRAHRARLALRACWPEDPSVSLSRAR
jgi:RNA polymerase sigma-70 factor, ECF subfamily